MIDRRSAMFGCAVAPWAASATAQELGTARADALLLGHAPPDHVIELWPHGAPGGLHPPLTEVIEERSKDPAIPDRAVHGISRPRMAVFRPPRPNGAAVLIAPGGGYRWVVIDKEGYEMGRWLAARGFTAFVLFYRLPGDGWEAGPDVALSDAQRAMRLIRYQAGDYGILPARIATMGFSAGGHVCGDLATRFATTTYRPVDPADELTARPDIAALIYAVQSMTPPLAHPGSRELLIGKNATPDLERAHTPALNVTHNTPPCFLLHAEDDPTVPIENSLQFRAALKAAGVPMETHLFASGGHGFGLRLAMGKPVEVWPELFVKWAATRGMG